MKASQIAPVASVAHTFVPTAALDNWFTAKAAAHSAQAGVVVMGDSITQGVSTTDFRTQSFAGLVGAALASQLGASAGEYFGTTESNTISTGTVPAGNQYWTFPAGTWAQFDINTGLTGWSALSTSSSGTAQFVPPTGVTFTAFDIIVHQETTGAAFTVTADGGTVTPSNGPSTCNGAFVPHVAFQYDGLTAASHTIVVTNAASSAKTMLAGIMIYPNGRTAPGLVYVRVNLAGKLTYILKQLWPATQPQYDGAAGSITAFNPKLVIQALCTNDCNVLLTYSFTRYAIGRSILAAQNAGASHICLVPYRGSPAANFDSWSHYVEVINSVSRGQNGAVLDVHSAWSAIPGGPVAAGLAAADGIHPTQAGHADIAARLLAMI